MKRMKLKGGTSYLSDMLIAMVSMFGSMFMIFIAALVVFVMNANIQANVFGEILYERPLADSVLLSIMDYEEDGIKTSEILSYALLYGNHSVYPLGDGRNISTLIDGRVSQFAQNYNYRLEYGGENLLARRSGHLVKKKTSQIPIAADSKIGIFILESEGIIQ